MEEKKTATQKRVAHSNPDVHYSIPLPIDVSDPLDSFMQRMCEILGYHPDTILPDGKFHRFSTSGKRDDTAGWYICFKMRLSSGEVVAGVFGDFRQGIKEKWHQFHHDRLSSVDMALLKARQAAAMKKARDVRLQDQKEAVAVAQKQWHNAIPASDSHPYLLRKKVRPHGIRQDGDVLLIPVKDEQGNLWWLQKIYPDGNKRFHKHGVVHGNFFPISNLAGESPICICEGYATGASIHQMTGYPVVCTFSANNLRPVAIKIRNRFPLRKIILCADNDAHLEAEGKVNIGVEKAKEAAHAIGAHLSIPPSDGTAVDFNDFYQAQCGQGGV